jgi:ATP adenylyltransferase/5',5'''-P-1,P-4-tetraphosphate phosphorylase II
MSWAERIISDAEIAFYWPGADRSFGARVHALLAQQQAVWPQLRAAVAGFVQVEYKTFRVKQSVVLAQHNPSRIVSTSARVDDATIKARPCFLCADNLPAAEQGIAFGAEHVVLCNPFPVLPKHLVIAARAHTPQAINGGFAALLDLTRELGAEFFTLYNGPRCGASAPDHLHFQAGARTLLPIWRELQTWRLRWLSPRQTVASFALPGYRINLLGVRSVERQALLEWLAQALRALANVMETNEEPLLNLLATFENDAWTVLLLPRQRHRPRCYDLASEAHLLISPAAIDLGGVVVVPQPEHFARLQARDLEQIFAEVALAEKRFADWLARLG